jgi:DNA-binding beta-propeller fold protein YncE
MVMKYLPMNTLSKSKIMMKKILSVIYCSLIVFMAHSQTNVYRSPVELQYSPNGQILAVTDFTKGSVYFIDAQTRKIKHELTGFDRPFGLVWVTTEQLAVSEYGSHKLCLVDALKYSVIQRISCVKYPMGIAMIGNGKVLVSGFGKGEMGVVDVKQGKQTSVIPVWYQPDFVAVSPDSKTALVSNLTPKSSGNGAKVSLIDLTGLKTIKEFELPYGSSNVRQVQFSPDGKWGYVVHTYGKVMLPTSQVERGWINTNVFSILDISTGLVYATIPFDFVIRGASDPWGISISSDGSRLYATLAGVHELAVVKLDLLLNYLSGKAKPEGLRRSDANAEIASNVWEKISKNPLDRKLLSDQFTALYAAGLLERYPLDVTGSRGLVTSPNKKSVVVAGYYSGNLTWFDLQKKKVSGNLKLGGEPEADLARKGEIAFHDGTSTLQGWLSCASCHPTGRADGLNWDLLNDGIGSPKNAKSLLFSPFTPPSMSTGIRANSEIAVTKGFHLTKFNEIDQATEKAVNAYLSAMKPDPSPYLNDFEKLTEKAARGKKLFESNEVGCINCHGGPYMTDQRLHNVGTKGKYDKHENYDTPSLFEVWRTAPYLHSGSFSSIEDLFSPKEGLPHWSNRTKHLSGEELSSLIEFVKSL